MAGGLAHLSRFDTRLQDAKHPERLADTFNLLNIVRLSHSGLLDEHQCVCVCVLAVYHCNSLSF